MFEQYTEGARAVIFFARYEASTFGAAQVETEHILLGLLREDLLLRGHLAPLPGAAEAIRREIEAVTPRKQDVSTLVQLPFSDEVETALLQADAECKALGEPLTDCGHLVLGLLRVEESLAAQLLRKHGVD